MTFKMSKLISLQKIHIKEYNVIQENQAKSMVYGH